MEGKESKQAENGSKSRFKFNIPKLNDDGNDKETYQVSSLFKAHKLGKQNPPTDTTPSIASSAGPSRPPPKQTSAAPVSTSSMPQPKQTLAEPKPTNSNVIKSKPADQPKLVRSAPVSEAAHNNSSGKVTSSMVKQNLNAPTTSTATSGQTDNQILKVTPGTTLNSIMINPRQKGNPIIKHIRNQPWQYGDCVPDYVLGRSTCALFLSLRYHNLHPDYVHDRMKDLGKSFDLRVLLVQVDVQDPHHTLKELAKICILSEFTLILAWSAEEAGRYLETYKAYESKPPELLMERTDQNYQARMTECLTSVKSVNKTNVITLLDAFKTFENISKSTVEDLSICPGFGPQKARRLHEVFRTPFLKPKRRLENEESPSKSDPKQKKTS